MSISKYNASTGELTNLASGSRVWVGSESAYRAEKSAGTLPNNAIICITDDEVDTCHYSTDETFTGMYWIDGKPIYRKCFSFNLTATTAWYSDCKISNANVIKIYGTLYHGDGALCLPYPSGVDITQTIELLYSDSMGVLIRTGVSTVVNEPVIIIIEYTKTTD